MRRALLATFVLAAIAASCSGGVDTKAPPGDDDDAATTLTPTPTPTGTATGTPTPSGLAGDPWTTTATPATDSCNFGGLTLTWGAAGVATIGIATTGSDLYFDLGLNSNPTQIAVVDAPSGTVDGGGVFTQTYSYCVFNGNTYRLYATWTGTFAADGLSFTDATLSQAVYFAGGNVLATCETSITTASAGCSGSPLVYVIDGVKQ